MEDKEAMPSKKPRGAAGSGLTAFALRAAKQLSAATATADADNGGNKNLVFSPVSFYAALALVAAGARGSTLAELLDVLGARSLDELAEFVRGVAARALADLSGSSRGGPLVAFACGVWHDETVELKPDYSAAAVEVYNAETRAVDFIKKEEEATEEINSWVSDATKGLITSILPPGSVQSLTRLVVANAIYFKGMWSVPFSAKRTETRRFRRLDGSHVSAPFMTSPKYQPVSSGDGFKVLKLPYAPYEIPRWDYRGRVAEPDGTQPRFSMCIFLPNAADGLPDLVDKMAAAGPSSLWEDLPTQRVEVREFWVPRFKLSFSGKMNGVLQAMGVKAAFDEDEVNLSGMLEGVDLVLEHVFHKAVIEVNEEGTEAAASSVGSSRKLQCARRSVDFVADHPFAFFVVEETSRAVVFMGHVLDPTATSD